MTSTTTPPQAPEGPRATEPEKLRRRHAFTSAPESMFVCPDCGHSQRNDESYELDYGSEITCTVCDAVSTVVEVEHEERDFTYEVTGRPTVPTEPQP